MNENPGFGPEEWFYRFWDMPGDCSEVANRTGRANVALAMGGSRFSLRHYLAAKAWPIVKPRMGPLDNPAGLWRNARGITVFQNWQSTWATILRDPNAACPWEDKCGAFLYPIGETIPRKFKCSACHREV